MTGWIKKEISEGLKRLMCLGLERTPAAEVIPLTAAVWVEAITEGRMWDPVLDAPRFRAAFAVLCRQSRSWPLPANLLEAMPERKQQLLTKQPIPAAPDSPQMLNRFEQIGAMLGLPRRKKAETGHGHVKPRADGVKARCGGPAICAECQREHALARAKRGSA